MGKINSAITEIYRIDNLAARDQWVNRLHPLAKLISTIAYIAILVSFPKYDVIGTISMGVYPLLMFQLADLSFLDCIGRLKAVLPLVIMVGIFNPFFDTTPVMIGSMVIRAGVLSMITLILKGFFALLAAYLLIATTNIEKICFAMRLLHVPKILVTEILLIYRYISLLLGEAERITQAYALRAPGQKGVHFRVWGSLAGQLLLRSMDRAENVYDSMLIRGFQGEFSYLSGDIRFRAADLVYGILWIGAFLLLRTVPVLLMIGSLFI